MADHRSAPPEYDTLSLAPPDIDDIGPSTEAGDATERSRRKSFKERWQQLKQEDEEHKAARLQYVTREEADKITGVDKLREKDALDVASGKKKGKGILAVMSMN